MRRNGKRETCKWTRLCATSEVTVSSKLLRDYFFFSPEAICSWDTAEGEVKMQLYDSAYNCVIFLMLNALSTFLFLFYKKLYFGSYRS